MKGLTRAQWINLNRNNRSVLVNRYSVLQEKIGPILPPLVGLTTGREGGREAGRQAGRQAEEIRVDFKILKLLYRLNYSELYFV